MKVPLLIVGLVLLMLGLGAAAAGFWASAGVTAAYNACLFTSPPAGFCEILLSPKAAYDAIAYVGVAVAIIGVVLTLVGAVSREEARPGLIGPAAAPWPSPPVQPQAGPPCPVCGQPLTWIAQYNRWYCGRCAQYR